MRAGAQSTLPPAGRKQVYTDTISLRETNPRELICGRCLRGRVPSPPRRLPAQAELAVLGGRTRPPARGGSPQTSPANPGRSRRAAEWAAAAAHRRRHTHVRPGPSRPRRHSDPSEGRAESEPSRQRQQPGGRRISADTVIRPRGRGLDSDCYRGIVAAAARGLRARTLAIRRSGPAGVRRPRAAGPARAGPTRACPIRVRPIRRAYTRGSVRVYTRGAGLLPGDTADAGGVHRGVGSGAVTDRGLCPARLRRIARHGRPSASLVV